MISSTNNPLVLVITHDGPFIQVTTVVTGNCSLSLAPVKNRAHADRIVGMFGRIEDIKRPTFNEGVPFEKWETFGQYLDHIKPNLSINVAPLVGHSAIRMYVMGEDSQKRTATPEEIKQVWKKTERS